MSESFMPYCDHPECHDPRTRLYADGAVTGTAQTDWDTVRHPKNVRLSGFRLPGERRWCRVHALMFEGVA